MIFLKCKQCVNKRNKHKGTKGFATALIYINLDLSTVIIGCPSNKAWLHNNVINAKIIKRN